MGAALTYARRYALFTLVGIAGEDDLGRSVSAIGQTGQSEAIHSPASMPRKAGPECGCGRHQRRSSRRAYERRLAEAELRNEEIWSDYPDDFANAAYRRAAELSRCSLRSRSWIATSLKKGRGDACRRPTQINARRVLTFVCLIPNLIRLYIDTGNAAYAHQYRNR
jgi:hypothetical protein